METFKQYPIRCKTCNEQIACFAATYEALIASGQSEEEALNNLGITEYCSRSAMFDPTIVAFNMENREVIEGLKSVDAADEADAQKESTEQPVFSACIGANNQIGKPVLTSPTVSPLARVISDTPATRVIPNAPGVVMPTVALTTLNTRPGIKTITLLQPTQRATTDIQQGIQPVLTSPPLVQPIIPTIELGGEIEAYGAGIAVTAPETKEFQIPTIVGVPTINPDPTIVQPTINVGFKHQSRVLNGRTYIAR